MGGYFSSPSAGGIDNFHSLTALDIDQKPVSFDSFKGQVVLVSNVASK